MLARKSALIVLVNVVGALGGWVSIKFIAVYFGPNPLGAVGFAFGIVGFFELLGDFGYNAAYLKRISGGADLAKAIGTFRLVKLALTSLMVLAVSAGLVVWVVVLGRPLVDTTLAVLALALLYAVLRALLTVPTLVFDARLETAKTQLAILVEHLFRVPMVVAVALLAGAAAGLGPWRDAPDDLVEVVRRNPAEALAFTYVVGIAASAAVAFFLARHYRAGRPSAAFLRSLTRFAMPTVLVAATGVLASQLDRVMIGFFYAKEEVGYYFAAQRISSLLWVVPLAVSTLLFPAVSERHAALDRQRILDLTQRAERYTTLFVAPAVVYFLFLAPPIVRVLLSEAFLPAAPVLVLLALATLILGIFQLHVALLAGMDRPGLQARSSILAFGLNGLLNLLLIPDHGLVLLVPIRGAVGAALATVIALTVGLGYLLVHSWRLAGKAPSLHLAKQSAVAVALGLVLWRATQVYVPTRAWQLLLYSALFFLLYLAGLWAVREFGREDVRVMWKAVHPAGLGCYVREELGRPPRP